ncbi:hypothetical protein LTR95_015999, partial [Oleoguttula sp. CCFEE 5521]
AHGKYVVRSASRRGFDVPHCATRIDTVAQLKLNTKLTLRMLAETASDLENGHASVLDSGIIVIRHLIDFRNRRLALLKEFELITAAQVMMHHLGCKGLLVSNTQLLLNQVGVGASPDIGKMSPSQRKMAEFAMRYDRTRSDSADSKRLAAELQACDGQVLSLRKFMIDYTELWFEEHDHLSNSRASDP